jgi:myo-inositol-1(or 4)-monophosphatase
MNRTIGSWDWITEIQTLCQKAGQFQVEHFRKNPPGWGEEKVEKEYVSWIDVESEHILQEGLDRICPEAGFYGEETGQSGNRDLQWVVDPLDGTTNYLSGLDQFAISIALVQVQQPELAVVYKPMAQEFFTAVRGQGARHNDRSLPRQTPFPISRAVVGTGFPYRSPDLVDPFLSCTKEVLAAVRDIRRLGCASVDSSYVAVGYLQGFWESDLQPYDLAAALLLLSETGCPYSGLRKSTYDMFHDRVIVIGRPGVYEELYTIVARHYQD